MIVCEVGWFLWVLMPVLVVVVVVVVEVLVLLGHVFLMPYIYILKIMIQANLAL